MKLSDHFDLEEFVVSQTASRNGIDNTPSPAVVESLKALCIHVLEPLRLALGPVSVSSGFRCLALNRAIGSKDTSQHILGQAADLSVKGKTLAEVFNWLRANAPFDQLIREYPPGGWIHVSYDPARARRVALLITPTGTFPQDGDVIV